MPPIRNPDKTKKRAEESLPVDIKLACPACGVMVGCQMEIVIMPHHDGPNRQTVQTIELRNAIGTLFGEVEFTKDCR
jgi:hypothetical protein